MGPTAAAVHRPRLLTAAPPTSQVAGNATVASMINLGEARLGWDGWGTGHVWGVHARAAACCCCVRARAWSPACPPHHRRRSGAGQPARPAAGLQGRPGGAGPQRSGRGALPRGAGGGGCGAPLASGAARLTSGGTQPLHPLLSTPTDLPLPHRLCAGPAPRRAGRRAPAGHHHRGGGGHHRAQHVRQQVRRAGGAGWAAGHAQRGGQSLRGCVPGGLPPSTPRRPLATLATAEVVFPALCRRDEEVFPSPNTLDIRRPNAEAQVGPGCWLLPSPWPAHGASLC